MEQEPASLGGGCISSGRAEVDPGIIIPAKARIKAVEAATTMASVARLVLN